jgi:glycine/D-amino acid oxidase-like deaminating enzyme
MAYRSTSYWFDSLGAEPEVRPSLPGDLDVDVAILGAGYTGLWTAYYLAIADPGCRIAVIEGEIAGFGASGRNGGWCSAMLEGLDEICEEDPEGGAKLREALIASVSEIGDICLKEGIEAEYHLGGGLMVAVDEIQAVRGREDVASDHALGWTEDDIRWLEPEEVQQRMRVPSDFGASFQKHVAAVNPAKLVRGLAETVERHGVTIYEKTRVTEVAPGKVQTSHGTVRAPRIVIALNGYKGNLPGHKRDMVPIYSHMVATEPFSEQLWDEIGLIPRGLFGDLSRLFTYAQRTADNRIAIGGRAPLYHWGSGVDPRFDRNAAVEEHLVQALRSMLPQLGDFKITHRWGGTVGINRDMVTRTSFDPVSGIASVGGFSGEGVAASNMAGQTFRDLLLGLDTELTALPWVGAPSPRWEPEPIRWLGVKTGIGLNRFADYLETRTGRRAKLIERLMEGLGMY